MWDFFGQKDKKKKKKLTKTEFLQKSTANQIFMFGWFIPVKSLIMHVCFIQNTSNDYEIVISNVNHRRQATQKFVTHGYAFVL